jgi:CRISPR-associated endonuclease/helicase Cas3
MPLAHSDRGRGGHDLEQHLRCTASQAAEFAAAFGAAEWGEAAGLWHDLGKFSRAFQAYLRHAGEDAAHAADQRAAGRVDHSTAGAIHASRALSARGRLLAYAIAGHHAGLPDWEVADGGRASLSARLTQGHLLESVRAESPPVDLLAPRVLPVLHQSTDLSLFVRMVFSALVDADRLDTEAFRNPEIAAARAPAAALTTLLEGAEYFLARLGTEAPDTAVKRHRRSLLEACRRAADQTPGLFSLTAPTGLGKTFSGLAFSLRHAVRHGLRRVIYVAPYTSITEQTADEFRKALGPEAVLEHHSNLDPDDETAASTAHRLAAENWDASVIVTTAVQFFESLFTAHPGRARKLHRIARAAVFLDEAQLLPPDYLRPILRCLQELMARYGTTVVLSTATQPAFDPRPEVQPAFAGLTGPEGRREIVADPAALHETMRRVRVNLPVDLNARTSWLELARELAAHPCVLCIVDRRADARELHATLPESTLHLSALMCGAHRSRVIREIRERRAGSESLRVISTQLVEAGVDLDFPVVFRALAGLDSLAQAAGRCNREGRLAEGGELRVFVPPRDPPRGHLRQAADVARVLLRDRPDDPFSPEMFRQYFERLYWLKGDALDAQRICTLLPPQPRDGGFAFRSASGRFRLIQDDEASVLVPYGEAGVALIADFQSAIRLNRPRSDLYRKAQRFRVGVPRDQLRRLEAVGIVFPLDADLWAAANFAYHSVYGLDIIARISPDSLIL